MADTNENLLDGVVKGFDDASTYITKVFDSVGTDMDLVMEPMITVATVIAGLASIIYLAKILLPMVERNEGIEIYPLLKPIFVAILVTQFGTFVSGLDGVLRGINDGVKDKYVAQEANFSGFDEAKKRNVERVKAEIAQKKAEHLEKANFWGIVKSIFSDGVEAVLGFNPEEIPDRLVIFLKYDVLFNVLHWLATIIGSVAYMCIILLSKFYLMFLAIMGPLAFALSQFSYFEGNFTNWLGKYISIGLWPGLANLVKYLSNEILAQMGSSLGDSFTASLVLCLLLVFVAYFYTQIPEVSEYIVTSGGAGGLNRSTLKTAGNVVKIGVAVPVGVAAGATAGLMAGRAANKFEDKVDKAVHAFSSKRGLPGWLERQGQNIGEKTGAVGRKVYENVKAYGRANVDMVKKSNQDPNASMSDNIQYGKQRMSDHRDHIRQYREARQDAYNAPRRKDLRKRAKEIGKQIATGNPVSQDQKEMYERYKAGEYKGRGKYQRSAEDIKRQNHKEFVNFMMKGFDKARRPKHQFDDNWRPPMAAPKRGIFNKK